MVVMLSCPGRSQLEGQRVEGTLLLSLLSSLSKEKENIGSNRLFRLGFPGLTWTPRGLVSPESNSQALLGLSVTDKSDRSIDHPS